MEPESSTEPSKNQSQSQEIDSDAINPSASPAVSGSPAEGSTSSVSGQPGPPAPNSKKRKLSPKTVILLLILLLGAIAASVALILYLRSADRTPSPAETSQSTPTPFTFRAKAEYLTGSAYKLIDDRRSQILEGDILDQDDVIETDKDSRLVISFDEGSVLRLDEESRITLSMLTSPLASVTQESGNVFYRVNKDEDHKFEVLAGDVKVETLGTAYSVEKEEKVKVKVFENKVKVLSQSTEVEVSEDQEWDETSQKVAQIDAQKLSASDFYQWSLTEEKLAKETPTPTAKPTAKPTAVPIKEKEETQTGSYIKLSGKAVAEGIKLQWKTVGLDTSKGFKIVKNLSGNPVYPGDHAQYMGSDSTYYLWKLTDGKTWHFRVCQYADGKCGVYSNEITITASGSSSESEGGVSSITLSANKTDDTSAKLTWSVEGSSAKGFKVVWSTNQNPTYPTRDGDWFVYLSDPGSRSYKIGSLETGKTYYFRVCEYLGSGCGVYSNQTSLSF